MAEKVWDYLRGLAVVLSDIAVCCLALALAPVVLHSGQSVAIHLWLLCAALQLLAGTCLVCAGVSWSVYLAIQGASIGVGSFLTVRASYFPVYGADMENLLVFCIVVVGMHNAFAAYQLPKPNGIMRYVDVLAAMTAFYLYCMFGTGLPEDRGCLITVSAVLALDLLVVNHLRTGGEGGNVIRGAGAGSRLALLGILVGCLAAAGAVVGVASGQVHSLVDLLLAALQGACRILSVVFGAVGRVLAYIILFFIALVPMAPERARENAAMQLGQEMDEVLGTGSRFLEYVFGIVFAAAGLALLIWVLYYLRNVRIRKRKLARRQRRVVRKSHLLSSVFMLWGMARDFLVFEWEYLRYRKTPQGLLVLAERTGKKRKLARRPDESPGAYIRRLDARLEGQPEGSPEAFALGRSEGSPEAFALGQLADILDKAIYAGRHWEAEAVDYKSCVRQIRSLR